MQMIRLLLLSFIMLCIGCADQQHQQKKLDIVAESGRLWTGIAVDNQNRIFVNYPRWIPGKGISVAEVLSVDSIRPFPDQVWNSWEPGKAGKDHFVCIQSVYVDADNFLWILDAGLDVTSGLVKGGPKLLKVDLNTNQIISKYFLDAPLTLPGSYLNDVRVDTERKYAYLTDSGRGALIVLNLKNSSARRLLGNHPSTKSEDITLVIEGSKWLDPRGNRPQIHSDGIALSPARDYIYFQALTAKNLYRIKTIYLRDSGISDTDLGAKIESVVQSGASDGLIFDRHGNLYISAIEENAVKRYTPDGKIEIVVQDSLLKWPDSFAIDSNKNLYVTSSQIHLGPKRNEPFRIFRYQLE